MVCPVRAAPSVPYQIPSPEQLAKDLAAVNPRDIVGRIAARSRQSDAAAEAAKRLKF